MATMALRGLINTLQNCLSSQSYEVALNLNHTNPCSPSCSGDARMGGCQDVWAAHVSQPIRRTSTRQETLLILIDQICV